MKDAVLDTSGWIEVLGRTERAVHYEPLFREEFVLRVPSVCLYEVAKFLGSMSPATTVEKTLRFMRRFPVEPLDAELAIQAASLGREHRLPMADAVIYATARRLDAELWTQDSDFQQLPGVRYFPRNSPRSEPALGRLRRRSLATPTRLHRHGTA